jgi:hypothetical protein
MLWNGALQLQTHPMRELSALHEAPCASQRTLSAEPLSYKLCGSRYRQAGVRLLQSQAYAAEPAPESTVQIEEPHVQARRRHNANSLRSITARHADKFDSGNKPVILA